MDLFNILANTDLCTSSAGQRLFGFVGYIIIFLQITIPVILIIMGSIDFIKALTAQKSDEIKKAQTAFIKRLILGVVIFFVPMVVKFVIGLVGGNDFTTNACLSCLSEPTKCSENGKKLEEERKKLQFTCPENTRLKEVSDEMCNSYFNCEQNPNCKQINGKWKCCEGDLR